MKTSKVLRKTAIRIWQAAILCFTCTAIFPLPASAANDAPAVVLSDGWRFAEQDGESLYRASCQGCHMAQGEGASGAGHFPALAGNPRLAGAAYPVYNVLHGRHGMPSFGKYMSDEQVAEVVNYTRTHLGNHYSDAVTAADVKKLR